MKAIIISATLGIYFCLIVLPSCESSAQKKDAAFELFKEEKMKSKDGNIIHKETIQETNSPKPVLKASLVNKNMPAKGPINKEKLDEWTKFRTEMGKKILANENSIKQIKSNPDENVKLYRKIARLEKHNSDLKNQMTEYNEEVKLKWEKFQSKINQDENDISNELQSLAIKDKK